MEYLQVVNLEKYQPNYNDGRRLIWIRWDIASLTDFKISSLSINGKWLFLTLVCLGTESKNIIPYDIKWLSLQSGIEKRHISMEIQMLQTIGLVVTKCDKMSPTDRQTDTTDSTDNTDRQTSYVAFEKATLDIWNSFCEKYPILSKVKEISEKRRLKLKKRYEKDSFKDFNAILEAIKDQKFLLGGQNGGWRVSFDWLIDNDTNYLKVLENRYQEKVNRSGIKSAKGACPDCLGTGFAEDSEGRHICHCRIG